MKGLRSIKSPDGCDLAGGCYPSAACCVQTMRVWPTKTRVPVSLRPSLSAAKVIENVSRQGKVSKMAAFSPLVSPLLLY